MTPREYEATKEGVAEAWDFWLHQHEISAPAFIQLAIKEAVIEWLDENEEAVLATLREPRE